MMIWLNWNRRHKPDCWTSNKVIAASKERLDDIFGELTAANLCAFVQDRFNMDGQEPLMRKVSSMSPNHIWAFMLDQ